MHIFWKHGELSAQAARDQLETEGRVLTYTTVATLCRILWEKGYVDRIGDARPFTFQPLRSFQEVSKSLIGDLIHKVFQGSREQFLLHVVGNPKLSKRKQKLLEELLREEAGADS